MATIAATGDKKLTNGYGPKLQGFVTISPGDLKKIHKMETEQIGSGTCRTHSGERVVLDVFTKVF